MKNKIRYTCTGYKYAPESFKCYMVIINPDGYNHSYYEVKEFTNEENNKVGLTYLSGGKEKAEAKIKHIIRGKKENNNTITYGYRVLNENGLICYLEYNRTEDDSDIQQKLKVYKNIKEHCQKENYIVSYYTVTSSELGGNYQSRNQQEYEE